MIKNRKEMVEDDVPVAFVCDVCKKEYDCEKDALEVQEFQCIQIDAGYASVFGDGVRLTADVCQHCMKKLLGEYLVEDKG